MQGRRRRSDRRVAPAGSMLEGPRSAEAGTPRRTGRRYPVGQPCSRQHPGGGQRLALCGRGRTSSAVGAARRSVVAPRPKPRPSWTRITRRKAWSHRASPLCGRESPLPRKTPGGRQDEQRRATATEARPPPYSAATKSVADAAWGGASCAPSPPVAATRADSSTDCASARNLVRNRTGSQRALTRSGSAAAMRSPFFRPAGAGRCRGRRLRTRRPEHAP